MAEKAADIIDWLRQFDDGDLVGIDEGGLNLEIVERGNLDESECYFEIGGMPEDVLLNTDEVMESIINCIRGKGGKEIADIHNNLCDECKIEYLEGSVWRKTDER